MSSIFSTQNLQTFLRRKNLRPPSRPPGPRSGRGPSGLPPCGRGDGVDTSWFSSAMFLLQTARSTARKSFFYVEILIFITGLKYSRPFLFRNAVSHQISDD